MVIATENKAEVVNNKKPEEKPKKTRKKTAEESK